MQALYRLYTCRLYKGSIQALYRLYTGSIQALYWITGSIQALYRLYTGSIQAMMSIGLRKVGFRANSSLCTWERRGLSFYFVAKCPEGQDKRITKNKEMKNVYR